MSRSHLRLANDAWESLLRAHAVVLRELTTGDDWAELSMREYDVLYTMSKAGGPLRIGDLQDHVLLSQPALSRMIDRLTRRKLVSRDPDPSDARGVLVALTPEGEEVQRSVGRRHARQVAAAMTGRLVPDDLALLEEVCNRLSTKPDPEPS